ncbi:hypothetical protein WR25_16824 [Diploscapter pachys]|uniref:Uncharacterized protein n=1 Tax=Diploscapter pachys TaxID=2018661 RepID=A0A2A2K4B8_9BILA|nr:hypothetical protein WR25_16824 [Diploscapter pachys]
MPWVERFSSAWPITCRTVYLLRNRVRCADSTYPAIAAAAWAKRRTAREISPWSNDAKPRRRAFSASPAGENCRPLRTTRSSRSASATSRCTSIAGSNTTHRARPPSGSRTTTRSANASRRQRASVSRRRRYSLLTRRRCFLSSPALIKSASMRCITASPWPKVSAAVRANTSMTGAGATM